MKKLIHRTLLVALAVGITVFLVSVPNAARAKVHPTTARHFAKRGVKCGVGKIGNRSTQASSGVWTAITADSTVYPAPPGVDTPSLAQAQQSVYDEEAGQKALSSGDLGTAEADFRSSTDAEHGASNVNAIVGLAQTLEREGKSRQAIHVYRYLLYPKQGWGTSLEEDPILRLRFALLLAGDGQWPEAAYVYENTIGGITLGPSFPNIRVHFSPNTPQPAALQAMAHLAMGVTYTNRLEHAQALSEYTSALGMQPDLAIAGYCYGYGLTRLGRRAEAKAAFEQARNTGGNDVKAAAEDELKGFK